MRGTKCLHGPRPRAGHFREGPEIAVRAGVRSAYALPLTFLSANALVFINDLPVTNYDLVKHNEKTTPDDQNEALLIAI